jgi:hypothetical protein
MWGKKEEVTMATKQITLDTNYRWEARGTPKIGRGPDCDPPKKQITFDPTYSWKARGTKGGKKKKTASRKRPS